MQARRTTGKKGGEKKKNMAPKVEKACHEIPSGFFQASPPRFPFNVGGYAKLFEILLLTTSWSLNTIICSKALKSAEKKLDDVKDLDLSNFPCLGYVVVWRNHIGGHLNIGQVHTYKIFEVMNNRSVGPPLNRLWSYIYIYALSYIYNEILFLAPRSEGLKKAMEVELEKAVNAVKEHKSRLENLNLQEARRILTIIFTKK